MHSADSTDSQVRVPRLISGWEDGEGVQNPAEGFLLSRIDGSTSWALLRQMGGLAPEEADACLERWLDQGILEIGGERAATSPNGSEPTGLDASLDLSQDLQRQILEYEARLDRPYHELLDVPPQADEREIKRAYFRLSRIFHPDIYFGHEIGSFAPRLDRIFKVIALAYELLMDPTTRAEIERCAPPPPEPDAQTGAEGAREAALKPSSKPQKLTKRQVLERLRRQFRIPKEILAERRMRAHEFHAAARVAIHQGRWNEAASQIRLSIAFDPWNPDYKESFAEVQAEVVQLRAEELLERAEGAFDSRSQEEALRLYEEVLAYRPADARVNERAASVAAEIGDYPRAQEYAERACELAPQDAAIRLTLGRVLRKAGLRERAVKAFQEASRLDPEEPTAKEEIRRLRRKPVAKRGGKS